MEGKQKEVFKWLAKLFKDSTIPEFEVTNENIEFLHSLMTSHTKAFQDVDIVLGEYEEKIKDYELHTSQISKILERLKINENILKDNDKKCFEAIVDISVNLGLSNSSSAIINPSIYAVENERNELNDALKKEQTKTKNLLRISQSLGKDIADLKRISLRAFHTEEQQNEELKSEERKSHFYNEKISNYSDEIPKLEVKLEYAGYDPSLTYETVSEKWKELQDLEKKLEDATQTLSSYTLPPDMDVAQAKVEEARKLLTDSVKGITQRY